MSAHTSQRFEVEVPHPRHPGRWIYYAGGLYRDEADDLQTLLEVRGLVSQVVLGDVLPDEPDDERELSAGTYWFGGTRVWGQA